MNQMPKLIIPVLLLLLLCTALSVASADSVAIKAEDGGNLPAIVPVGETFTVLITDGGSHVGAGTNVVFMLPAFGGDQIYTPTDGNGKAWYKPNSTGTLGIRVLDGTVTVAEATVAVEEAISEPLALASVEISPMSADLVIGGTQPFTAVCNDTSGDPITDGCMLTWSCDRPLVGTINSSGFFTADGVGTATVTVTATYNGVTKTDSADVNVDGSTKTIPVTGDNFTEPPIDAGTAEINISGEFDNSTTGNIDVTAVADPEAAAGYAFKGDGQTLMGLNVTPNATIRDELANGNDTIRIEICYNAAELERLNIDPATLAIWRHNGSTWVKMVNGTDPCIGNGRDGTCVWVELNNLSLFTLVGSLKKLLGSDGSSGGGGTYPPGWYETPTPVPTTTATAEPTESEPSDESETTDESTTGDAEETATTGTEGEGDAATAEEETPTTELKTKGIPGFSAFLVIAGLLAAMYLVLRRRD